MASKTASPRLTVKALAEMLRMPAYEQVRVLHDQKYPKQQPQTFRTPYYQTSLTGIRDFYRAGNDARVLSSARNDLQNIGSKSRRTHNLRVLEAFSNSALSRRKLQPLPNTRYSATIGSVEIRLSPDLQALEDGELRVIYFNCRAAPITDEIAALTVEIGNWVLAQNEVEIAFDHVEVVDLVNGTVHRRKKGRSNTITTLKTNSRIIEALWSTV